MFLIVSLNIIPPPYIPLVLFQLYLLHLPTLTRLFLMNYARPLRVAAAAGTDICRDSFPYD